MKSDGVKLRDRLQRSETPPPPLDHGVSVGRGGGGGGARVRRHPVASSSGWARRHPSRSCPRRASCQSSLRQNLARAGIYQPSAAQVVTGCKLIFLVLGVVGGYVVGSSMGQMLFGVSLGGLLGYVAPTMWSRAASRRTSRPPTYGLADAVGLRGRLGVEVGLTVDSAMQRVGQVRAGPPGPRPRDGHAHMETRPGSPALNHCGIWGPEPGTRALQSFVSMLIQAERSAPASPPHCGSTPTRCGRPASTRRRNWRPCRSR